MGENGCAKFYNCIEQVKKAVRYNFSVQRRKRNNEKQSETERNSSGRNITVQCITVQYILVVLFSKIARGACKRTEDMI